jgi:hypothetical protein
MPVADRTVAPASRNMNIGGWVPARAEPVIGRRFATRWLGRDDVVGIGNVKNSDNFDVTILAGGLSLLHVIV